MNRRIINARFSIIGRALYFLGVFFFRRNPSADTPTRYAWDVYARLWHPLLWIYALAFLVYALAYAVYHCLASNIKPTIKMIRLHGWMKIAYSPKEQDTPNQTTPQQ